MLKKITGFIKKIIDTVLGWIFGLRVQLIVPYFVLTLIIAMGGIFIITNLVTGSVDERFANQLIEASRVASDVIATQENYHLENLRTMAFTVGIPEAMAEKNTEEIQNLLHPIIVNEEIQSLSVVDLDGIELLSIIQNPKTGEYLVSSGGDLSGLELVRLPLVGFSDEFGNKFSSLEQTAYGPYMLTSTPVYNGETLVGAMVIGTNLSNLVIRIKEVALADNVLLDRNGKMLAWSFVSLGEDSDDPSLTPSQILEMNPSLTDKLDISNREYQVYYAPMILRNREVGVVAVALPTTFVVTTEATSRNSLSLVFSCATLSMILIGYILAISILRPIKRLRDVSIAVASGDLDQQSGLRRRDEIGDLAQSFDSMTSQLRERTAELVQSEKLSAVGQLAAGIAHDVKNPLAIIKGMAEEMQEENQGDSDMVEYLQLIRDNADRANTIISDLMKFSRQSESEMQYLNIVDTVNSSIRLTEYMARKANVALEVKPTQNRIMLNFDPQQIEQVLINLIQNAIQAMDAGGKLTLRAGTIGPWAVVEIQDTGKGIPKENLQRIFDPFFTTKPVGEGTGLGLSVSYGIIKKHGGDIKVKSTVGVGTTFTIRLPLGENGNA